MCNLILTRIFLLGNLTITSEQIIVIWCDITCTKLSDVTFTNTLFRLSALILYVCTRRAKIIQYNIFVSSNMDNFWRLSLFLAVYFNILKKLWESIDLKLPDKFFSLRSSHSHFNKKKSFLPPKCLLGTENMEITYFIE